MNKKIIWGLFDDGEMSYMKAQDHFSDCEFHSIGIQDHPEIKNYHKINLSITNDKLIKCEECIVWKC